jgi:hypothetical protein
LNVECFHVGDSSIICSGHSKGSDLLVTSRSESGQ